MTADIPQNHKASPWRLRLAERRILLLLGDFLMAALALGIGLYYWAQAQPFPFFQFLQRQFEGWFVLLPFAWLLLLGDLYDPNRAADLRKTLRGVALAALIGLVVYTFIYFTSTPSSLPRRGVAGFLLAAAVLTILWRILYIRIFTAPEFMHRVLLAGGGQTGQALLAVIDRLQPPPFYLVGVIDDDREKIGTQICGYDVLGGSDCLPEIVAKEVVSEVIVAISGKIGDPMFRALLDAQERGVEIVRMPVAYEELLGRVPVHHLEADWILRSFVDEARINSYYRMGKRILDVIGGFVGVVILLLIGPLVALGILLESGRPVVFVQTRAGRGGQPYKIIKFRSMRQDAEQEGGPQLAKENDARATRFGRFLRKTHLDEWPQFVNVLRGEMSLVGPRPERPELMEYFQSQIPFYRARLLAKPGIAGWAQIHFAYASTLDEMVMKLEYDLYYIKHRSIFMDLFIILRTIGTIFGFRGR